MAEIELRVYQIGQDDGLYVTVRDAAKYWHITFDRTQDLIALGMIPTVQIESRQLIEYAFVKTFEVPPPRRWGRSAWLY